MVVKILLSQAIDIIWVGVGQSLMDDCFTELLVRAKCILVLLIDVFVIHRDGLVNLRLKVYKFGFLWVCNILSIFKDRLAAEERLPFVAIQETLF